ncbi:MAG: aminotransferase class IV [SAR324 cluster bacterium]|nr:aminotransferase class IV [SAR324 cluster bacterium]
MPAENPYADGAAFMEGRYMPISEARIPITDWGFTRSDVTYDVVHVWQGRFFRLEDHLDRFERSAAGLRLNLPHSRQSMREILGECVRLTGLRDAYVEMGCTRGVPPPGTRDPRELRNRYFAFALPFIWIATEEQRKRGLHLVISQVQRIPPESVDPTIKNFHWGDLMRGLYEAYDRGGETAVLVDGSGNVTEGPGFNIFVVKDGQVCTPARGVLEGITRMTVLELCAECDLPLQLGDVSAQAVRSADEVFLSSTAGGVLPVTKVDGKALGTGEPGPVTNRLRDLYWSKKEAGWHGTPLQ